MPKEKETVPTAEHELLAPVAPYRRGGSWEVGLPSSYSRKDRSTAVVAGWANSDGYCRNRPRVGLSRQAVCRFKNIRPARRLAKPRGL
jgi:hypothetical protein